MTQLTYGSLFSGIGGIDLGLDRAGMYCKWQVEIDAYCQKVLAKHWPNVARYGDIRDCGAHNLESVDLICGGFPCQDISVAGKRAGIEGERSGLWKEFYRVICELQPQYVLVENVSALLHRGIERVLGDLASCGYDAEWQVLSAEALGAPHLRERVFIVGYPMRLRCNDRGNHRQGRYIYDYSEWDNQTTSENWKRLQSEPRETSQDVSDTTSKRLEGQQWAILQGRGMRSTNGNKDVAYSKSIGRVARRAEPEGQQRKVVFGEYRPSRSNQWAVEPNVGRVANGISSRVDRLKGLGNAVVPQVAEYVGRCILAAIEAEEVAVS